MAAVEVLASEGPTGAAFMVRAIRDERMIRDAQKLAHKLQLNGFCGLDYVIEKSSHVPYLIEVNPRCTQLGHLPLAGGRDLAAALCEKLTGRINEAESHSLEGRIVAFFPQVERLATRGAISEGVYKDIPQGQPRLLSELMRPVREERRWVSRLSHRFRPERRSEPVEFCSDAEEFSVVPDNQTPIGPASLSGGC